MLCNFKETATEEFDVEGLDFNENTSYLGTIYKETDGYFWFEPCRDSKLLCCKVLIEIANKLSWLNVGRWEHV